MPDPTAVAPSPGWSGAVRRYHHVTARAARAVDNGDGLAVTGGGRRFWRGGRLCVGRRIGRLAGGRRRRFRRTGGALDDDAGNRLAAERIVVEDGKACETEQEHAQQHRGDLCRGERQAELPLARAGFAERCAQIVRRHGAPTGLRITARRIARVPHP
jgi:hypothetical protein